MGVTSNASGVKAGTVAYFAGASAPVGWIKANGAAVSRATYEALFIAIGTTYGVGDGSTTFNLPDLRGEFMRGLDDGRGVDSGRGIGTAQGQTVQSHQHGLSAHPWGDGFGGIGGSSIGGESRGATQWLTDGAGGDETRPRNVAMLACIKY